MILLHWFICSRFDLAEWIGRIQSESARGVLGFEGRTLPYLWGRPLWTMLGFRRDELVGLGNVVFAWEGSRKSRFWSVPGWLWTGPGANWTELTISRWILDCIGLYFWISRLDFWTSRLDFWTSRLNFWTSRLDFWIQDWTFAFQDCIFGLGDFELQDWTVRLQRILGGASKSGVRGGVNPSP